MMVAEVCTTEYGSVGQADNQEVTVEKSIDRSRPKIKADMVAFDRAAFYRRQGVDIDSPKAEMVEQRMSTVEFEPVLADHIPVMLTQEREQKKRAKAPDLNNRQQFYMRQGVDLTQIQSEQSSSAKTYDLPTLKPMMSLVAYQAIKFEEKRTTETQQDDDEGEIDSSNTEEGNIETAD